MFLSSVVGLLTYTYWVTDLRVAEPTPKSVNRNVGTKSHSNVKRGGGNEVRCGAGLHLDNLIPTPQTTTATMAATEGYNWARQGRQVGELARVRDACFHEVTVYTPRAQSGGGGCNANAFCERLTVPVLPPPYPTRAVWLHLWLNSREPLQLIRCGAPEACADSASTGSKRAPSRQLEWCGTARAAHA